jgi:membrane protease YdiL (CAAX protease family)
MPGELLLRRIPIAMSLLVPFLLSLVTGLLAATVLAMGIAWLWAIGRLANRKPLFPEEKTCLVPWTTRAFLLCFLEWVVINVAIAQVYFAASGIRPRQQALTAGQQMILGSLVNITLLIVLPASLVRVSRSASALRRLGIHREGLGRHVRQGAVAFLLLAPVVYAVQYEAGVIWKSRTHPIEDMLVAQPSAGMALFTFLAAVILAPVTEELVFRGILQNWLSGLSLRSSSNRKAVLADGDDLVDPLDLVQMPEHSESAPDGDPPFERVGSPSGSGHSDEGETPRDEPEEFGPGEKPVSCRRSIMPVVITSAVFAALHAPQWPAPIAIFLLAMGLGILYQRTGSLVTSFTMHALFNGFSMLMLFLFVLTGARTDTKKPALPARKAPAVTSCVVPAVPSPVERVRR